jgi:hypothetical protein
VWKGCRCYIYIYIYIYIYMQCVIFYKRMHSTAVRVLNRNVISDTSGYQYTFNLHNARSCICSKISHVCLKSVIILFNCLMSLCNSFTDCIATDIMALSLNTVEIDIRTRL